MNPQTFLLLQRVLPKAALTELVGRLTRIEGGAITHAAIRAFARHYNVELDEALDSDPAAYATFNAFFTRALKPGARPLPDDENVFVSPADGCLSQIGPIDGDLLVQAKGRDYRLIDLCDGDAALASRFTGGRFATIYLSPRNYHRVHMPAAGTARALRHVPGALFSVNAATTGTLDQLFCRNERMLALFDRGEHSFALIMVAAMNVSGIELTFPRGAVANNRPQPTIPSHRTLTVDGPALERGAEFGRFNMGSTVVVLTSPGFVEWDAMRAPDQPIRMGEALGRG